MLRLESCLHNRFLQGDLLIRSFCGSEANVAVSLANFNDEVEFITKIPANEIGEEAIRSLRGFGVDVKNCKLGNGRMGLYFLEKGASQRPSKIIYDRKDSVFSLIKKNEFDWESLLNNVDWFHWSGITPALSNELFETLLDALQYSKNNGIFISCDLNYRKMLWSENKAQEKMKQLIKYVDLCIGNEEDAAMALGINKKQSDVPANSLRIDDYRYIAHTIFQEYGCEKVAFSLRDSYSADDNGWSGIIYDGISDTLYESLKYKIHIIDRVGAGDSFAAGLIHALINDFDLQYSINFAVAASCLKHTIEGDFNRISLVEVENLMNGMSSGRICR